MTAVALALAGLLAAAASAAPTSNAPAITFVAPSAAEGATLTTNAVQFAITSNRTPKQTKTLTCALAGPTSSSGPCDAALASGAGSQSGTSYGGLANGAYTLTVSLTLTDGGVVSATRHFTIDVPVGHVYWANSGMGTIGRANLDGTDANQSFISGVDYGMAVDAGHVYWTSYSTGTIGRANLDGTDANRSFITGAVHPFGVAVDAGHVYWTNYPAGTIGRANLDGTDANQSFITGPYWSSPYAVAVDAGQR